MGFSIDQKRAIEHRDGPAMVLAGPGSGKTTVITHRILQLIRSGVRPEDILVITFTKAAALEMESRFRKLYLEEQMKQRLRDAYEAEAGHRPAFSSGEDARLPGSLRDAGGQVSFGTFHSVFFFILRIRYHFSYKNILSERAQSQILREIAEALGIDCSYDQDFLRLLIGEISRFKGSGKLLSEFDSSLLSNEQFTALMLRYQERLGQQRLVDFDDMLLRCRQLFRDEPAELRRWQEKYKYLLVDEFQDISPLQYEIVRMLALPENNLFIVGDDDQSIYAFRGSDPRIMLGFERDYPGATRITLSNNYRSHEEIVTFSAHVIARNEHRFPKEITAVRGAGGRALRYQASDTLQEYALVLKNIREELARGIPPERIAVLFRTQTLARPLISEFVRLQLPYTTRDHTKNLYDSTVAQDILAYIRLALGTGTRRDFMRIMNKPNRYISREAVRDRAMDFEKLRRYYRDKRGMDVILDRFVEDLKAIRALPSEAAVIYIGLRVGYLSYLEAWARENHTELDGVHAIMDALELSARQEPDKQKWLSYAENYGEELKRAAVRNEAGRGVRLMTFHGSKGLEFDIVHIIDATEGVTPYAKAVTAAQIEEERRAFYVACTRAKKELHIYFTESRYAKKCSPSRFLLDGLSDAKPRHGGRVRSLPEIFRRRRS